MPERIQLKRVKGWRIPEGAVKVDRTTKFGNPFKPGKLLILSGKRAGNYATAADVVELYKQALLANPDGVATVRRELRGKDLCCWCALDAPCHADVLLEVANRAVTDADL